MQSNYLHYQHRVISQHIRFRFNWHEMSWPEVHISQCHRFSPMLAAVVTSPLPSVGKIPHTFTHPVVALKTKIWMWCEMKCKKRQFLPSPHMVRKFGTSLPHFQVQYRNLHTRHHPSVHIFLCSIAPHCQLRSRRWNDLDPLCNAIWVSLLFALQPLRPNISKRLQYSHFVPDWMPYVPTENTSIWYEMSSILYFRPVQVCPTFCGFSNTCTTWSPCTTNSPFQGIGDIASYHMHLLPTAS